MERICKECKFWGKPWKNELGIMSAKCKSKKFIIGFGDDITEKDQLSYCDSEQYSVSLVTGEEFGCIHFHEKK